jgi:microphthalmia-associated transcription factor
LTNKIFHLTGLIFCFSLHRPTFKTVVPTSRTALKQQLQREQFQDLERREAHKRLSSTASSDNNVQAAAQIQAQVLHQQQQQQQQEFQLEQQNQHNMSSQSPQPSNNVKVPLQKIGVDVPPQVLQVNLKKNGRNTPNINASGFFEGSN